MRKSTLIVPLLLFATMCAPAFSLQETSLSKVEADTFFSGTVIAMSQEKLTVSRTVLGKPAENRDFLMNGATIVEGKLKSKCRVTVRFAAGDQGEVAISIIVRDKQEKKK